ncbi:MAG: DUF1499 domain-containing protein [Candidatus Binatia bacterium]
MSPNSSNVSKAAQTGGTLGLVAAVFVVVGVGSAALQILPAFGGFLLMVFGLALALLGAVLSIVGIIATSPGRNREGRPAAMRGFALCLLTIVALGVPAMRGSNVPRINDITTSVDDPPAFVSASEAEPNKGRDMSYDAAALAEVQREGYPDLASLVIEDSPDEAFDKVRRALAGMPRMEITGEDKAAGRIEATETSALFHFKDDVVVRIRPFQDGGSRIDVRSKSRDGKGDLGVNAARIRTLLGLVRASAKPVSTATP